MTDLDELDFNATAGSGIGTDAAGDTHAVSDAAGNASNPTTGLAAAQTDGGPPRPPLPTGDLAAPAPQDPGAEFHNQMMSQLLQPAPDPADWVMDFDHPDLPHLAFAGSVLRGAQDYQDANAGALPSGQALKDLGDRAMLESYGTTDRSAIPSNHGDPDAPGLSGVFARLGRSIAEQLNPGAYVGTPAAPSVSGGRGAPMPGDKGGGADASPLAGLGQSLSDAIIPAAGAAEAPPASSPPVQGQADAELPAYKRDVFKDQMAGWHGFVGAVKGLPGSGPNEQFAYPKIYAAEGGTAIDPASGASGGIMPQTLQDGKAAGLPGLKDVAQPGDMDAGQRATLMRHYFDTTLHTVGGHAALDAIGDQQAAAAFADTLYRFGGAGGTKIIQQAINRLTPGAVAQDGQMGPQTLAAYKKMAADPKTRGSLLDQVAKARGEVHGIGGDAARNDYFRFRDNK